MLREAFDPSSDTVAFLVGQMRFLEIDSLDHGLYLVSIADPTPRRVDIPCPERPDEQCVSYDIWWSAERSAFAFDFYSGPRGTLTSEDVVTFDGAP